jgi:hypothetical protein
MQSDRQIQGSPVEGEFGGRERRRAEHGFCVVRITVAFGWDPQPVAVKLAVHVFIVNNGKRICSRRDVCKDATRLGIFEFLFAVRFQR